MVSRKGLDTLTLVRRRSEPSWCWLQDPDQSMLCQTSRIEACSSRSAHCRREERGVTWQPLKVGRESLCSISTLHCRCRGAQCNSDRVDNDPVSPIESSREDLKLAISIVAGVCSLAFLFVAVSLAQRDLIRLVVWNFDVLFSTSRELH